MLAPLDVLLRVAETLERLGVDYVVVGSFASSARGRPRAAANVDLVVDLRPEHAAPLASSLGSELALDEAAMRRAIDGHRSFTLVHLDAIFEVHLFVPPPAGFHREQLLRRQREIVTVDPERSVYIATAEDTVLAKLHWYEEGGRASEQQWADVLGVLRVQAGRLDVEFMRAAALRLAVGDLLDRALQEAREDDSGRKDRYV